MLQNPTQNTVQSIIEEFNTLKWIYYVECKGPAKDDIWQQFESKTMEKCIQNFIHLKGYNDKAMKKEQELAMQRERTRIMKEENERQKSEYEQQQQSLQNKIQNIQNERAKEAANHEQTLQDAEKEKNHALDLQFNEIAQSFKERQDEWDRQRREQQKNMMRRCKK